eukprot:580769-Pyramimonas_sp.AAC.1
MDGLGGGAGAADAGGDGARGAGLLRHQDGQQQPQDHPADGARGLPRAGAARPGAQGEDRRGDRIGGACEGPTVS